MVPLYAARIEDLGPGDFVRVECIACHNELIPHQLTTERTAAATLYDRARSRASAPLPRMRCKREGGRVITWAAA